MSHDISFLALSIVMLFWQIYKKKISTHLINFHFGLTASKASTANDKDVINGPAGNNRIWNEIHFTVYTALRTVQRITTKKPNESIQMFVHIKLLRYIGSMPYPMRYSELWFCICVSFRFSYYAIWRVGLLAAYSILYGYRLNEF